MFERIQRPTRIRSEGEQVKHQRRQEIRQRQEERGQSRRNKREAV